jgi:hypothetical protein
VTVCKLLHHGADALGLLKRILHHLLQVNPFPRRLRKLMAMLLDLAHVEQQRSQRPVELTCYRSPGFIHRQRARSRQPDNFLIAFRRRAAFGPLREMRIADSVFWL